MLRASLDATAGSVIENALRISPSSSGSSHCLRCSSVANRCRVSMLPVSGAAQLITSGAISSAPAGQLGQRRVLQVGQARHRRQEQVPQAALLGQDLQFLDDRRDGVVVGPRLGPVLVVGRLGGEDEFRHERRQAFVVVLRLGRHREVHVATLKGAQNGLMTESRPPFPPFTLETAQQKVQAAEDAWNTRDPERVSLAYTARLPLAQSRPAHRRARADRRVSDAEVAARTRLRAAQEPVGFPQQPDRRALPVRMP